MIREHTDRLQSRKQSLQRKLVAELTTDEALKLGKYQEAWEILNSQEWTSDDV
jgi:hypothetical protein